MSFTDNIPCISTLLSTFNSLVVTLPFTDKFPGYLVLDTFPFLDISIFIYILEI